jgi:protease I
MTDLRKKRIAVLVSDGFEESELIEPTHALREAGATVEIVSATHEPLQAFRHHQPTSKIDVDKTFDEADPAQYDAVLLPGGALNADETRALPQAQSFVRKINEARKPMAVICHAPWLLASTGLARGRTLTSWPTIGDDLRNAGAQWVDREVVVDDNIVTSRGPKDLPAFNREMLSLFAR